MCAKDPSTHLPGGANPDTFWFTPGGKIEAEETLHQAAQRELWEETGINPKKVEWGPIVWKGSFNLILSGIHTHLKQQFIVAKTRDNALTQNNLTPQERRVIKDFKWFSFQAIKESQTPIYPKSMVEHLPGILQGNYPTHPLEIALAET